MTRERFQYKEVGFRYRSVDYFVDPAELAEFYKLPGIEEPMFVSDEASRALNVGYERKIVPAAFVMGLVFRLNGQTELAHGGIFLEVKSARFTAPVYPGDTLHIEGELLSKRPTSKGDKVVVVYAWELKNQNNAVVAAGQNTELMDRPG